MFLVDDWRAIRRISSKAWIMNLKPNAIFPIIFVQELHWLSYQMHSRICIFLILRFRRMMVSNMQPKNVILYSPPHYLKIELIHACFMFIWNNLRGFHYLADAYSSLCFSWGGDVMFLALLGASMLHAIHTSSTCANVIEKIQKVVGMLICFLAFKWLVLVVFYAGILILCVYECFP